MSTGATGDALGYVILISLGLLLVVALTEIGHARRACDTALAAITAASSADQH